MAVETLDTTLRDGAQAVGLSFSIPDKLDVITVLDEFGIDIIECGNPYSNPRDRRLFAQAKSLRLSHARIAAFGQTRKKNSRPEEDENLRSLLESEAPIISIVGKSSLLHAEEVLKASAEENLQMISSSIQFLKQEGRTVYFDCEHFFDGYKLNRDYALLTLKAAIEAGADMLVLCDTNGGALPSFVAETVSDCCKIYPNKIGVHFHNDRSMAVSNTISSVQFGANHIQGTFNGYGERCGNASLAIILPILMEESPEKCPEIDMKQLTHVAKAIASIADSPIPPGMPFVGEHAFTHKGGLHIDAMQKLDHAYEHIEPSKVGNERHVALSDMSGRGAIMGIISRIFGQDYDKDSHQAIELLEAIKAKEADGYQFEEAEASLDLLALQTFGMLKLPYSVELYRVIGEKAVGSKNNLASAFVKVSVGDRIEIAAAEGNGPVNALDKALRKALESFFPSLKELYLYDYRVRVIDPDSATAAKVRVVMKSASRGIQSSFATVGVSSDVIDASFKALLDAFAFHLVRQS